METILGADIVVLGKKKDEEVKAAYEAAIKREADVIVTAVALGFAGARYHLNQPCRFDYEHPTPEQQMKWENLLHDKDKYRRAEERVGAVGGEAGTAKKEDYDENDKTFEEYKKFVEEIRDFEHVMSAMSFVLDKTDKRIGAFLKDGQSRQWSPGALITGLAGGQMLDHDERHRTLQNESAIKTADEVTKIPEFFTIETLPELTGEATLYVGKGAYTGMISDPVGNQKLVQRTKRVIDRDKLWHPGETLAGKDKPWGLITSEHDKDVNLKDLMEGGLGALPLTVKSNTDIIRYIHGMTSAIVKCVSAGPWCYPFEHASGKITTKMASCFPCTTYMYATGFPPSSTHLGRGESWVPPKPALLSAEKIEEGIPEYYNDNITKSLMTRWHWDIYHYLNLGVRYLKRAVEAQREDQSKLKCASVAKTVIDYVNHDHVEAVLFLEQKLSQYNNTVIGSEGGNLFLDALTVHDSDWKRVLRTLYPVYNYYSNQPKRPKDEKGPLVQQLVAGDILAI